MPCASSAPTSVPSVYRPSGRVVCSTAVAAATRALAPSTALASAAACSWRARAVAAAVFPA